MCSLQGTINQCSMHGLHHSSSLFDSSRDHRFHFLPPVFPIQHCCFQVCLCQTCVSRDGIRILQLTSTMMFRCPEYQRGNYFPFSSKTVPSKLDTSPHYGVCMNFFLRFCPFGPKLWGKRGFFKCGTQSLNTNIDLSYIGV